MYNQNPVANTESPKTKKKYAGKNDFSVEKN